MLLSSLILPIEAEQKPDPHHVQGWFYSLIYKIEPELHDSHSLQPFTLAVGGSSGSFWLRITFISEALYSALSPKLYILSGQEIRLGNSRVRVKTVIHDKHPWAGLSTIPRLFQGEATSDFPFRFATPTFFKRKGAHYPLPEPLLVFGSLSSRLFAHSTLESPGWLPEAIGRMTLRAYTLRTHPIEHEVRAVGFTGRAIFHLPRASEEEARWLTALWRFAFFSGVGAKTTLGFGQVKPYAPRKSPVGGEDGQSGQDEN